MLRNIRKHRLHIVVLLQLVDENFDLMANIPIEADEIESLMAAN